MRIDVHVHTKKVKSGDAQTRNIQANRFAEIIKSTDVGILAITNHNHFDLQQYSELSKSVKQVCQIWPGIELDILESGRRAHLLLICNPKEVKKFSRTVELILEGTTADSFTISLDAVASAFAKLDIVYIAHYHSKKPNLVDADVEKLVELVGKTNRVIKEATNAISAGIYISHGHNSIYGSDVHDWNEYVEIAKTLPELRLPVESFEQFTLLLEKDIATIDTLMHRKVKERIPLSPFSVAEMIDIDIYNDINILFGSKGTGKTEILKCLSKYYNELGYRTYVYESSLKRIDDVYDLKGVNYELNMTSLGLDDCVEEFTIIRNAGDCEVTSISSYTRYFNWAETNTISKGMLVKNFRPLDGTKSDRALNDVVNRLRKIDEFMNDISEDSILRDIVGIELMDKLTELLDEISAKLKAESSNRSIDHYGTTLFNMFIKVFVEEIAKKTGQPVKPIETGFKQYASNRIRIERAIKRIRENLSVPVQSTDVRVGSLGEKGELYCRTNLTLQNGSFRNTDYRPLRAAKKGVQKEVAVKLNQIYNNVYTSALFEKIAELNDIENGGNVESIADLILFHRHFLLNGESYIPSNGESSMVLLHNELMNEKEIYLIDEPEKSLGNDYISEVIVPLLKERAKLGKKIIIATHDANIAVRTLPYSSIYRLHDSGRYFTFGGNPFANSLKCFGGLKQDLDWKEISMKTLEGGRNAFGERRKIYGHV